MNSGVETPKLDDGIADNEVPRVPHFVDVGAGDALLSRMLLMAGFLAHSFDYKRSPLSVMPTTRLDLASSEEIRGFEQSMSEWTPLVMHVSVPTRHRLHEEPISTQTLRADMYHNVVRLVKCVLALGGQCVLEAPTSSAFWESSVYAALSGLLPYQTTCQPCRFEPHGPQRRWLTLWASESWILNLGGACNYHDLQVKFLKPHHGKYPRPFCIQYLMALLRHDSARNWLLTPIGAPPHDTGFFKKKDQPRGKQVPALVPEFKRFLVAGDHPPTEYCRKVPLEMGGRVEGLQHDEFLWGECFTPEEYLTLSANLRHPVDIHPLLPDEFLLGIINLVEKSFEETVDFWRCQVRSLLAMVEDNKREDAKYFEVIDYNVGRVLKGKRLATWKNLLDSIKYADVDLIKHVSEGFKLVGRAPVSGVFLDDPVDPAITMDQFVVDLDMRNHAALRRVSSCGDHGVDVRLFESTMLEIDRGWLAGPFESYDLLCGHLGRSVVLNRRFPVIQPGKIRPIDDFSESCVNSAFGQSEKVQLHDADLFVAMVRVLDDICAGHLTRLILADGSVVDVKLHADWRSAPRMLGRTLDLSSAYKQVAVASSDLWLAGGVVWDPYREKPCFFAQRSLPFGSASSVHAFTRCSKAIWKLGIEKFKILWSVYFDDFPTLAPEPLARPMRLMSEVLNQAIGWRISSGDKALDFAEVFQVLGVVFSFGRLGHRESVVTNKPERVKLVQETIDSITAGSFTKKQAETLRGKLQFMELQVFGRAARTYRGDLDSFIHSGSHVDMLRRNLSWLVTWLSTAPPRQICAPASMRPNLLFTDGACEGVGDDLHLSCGALLVDGSDGSRHMFGVELTGGLADTWLASGKRQLVTEAELMPILLSLTIWDARMRNSKTITFVDSEPAKFICIAGRSHSDSCSAIVRQIARKECELQVWQWYTRVPSQSNPADGASRMLVDTEAARWGAKLYYPRVPSSLGPG